MERTGSGLYFLENGKTFEAIERVPLRDLPVQEKYSGTVWAILEDSDNTVWFGMEGEGLFSLKEGELKNFVHDPGNPSSLNGNAVRCIFEDSFRQLWVGTWDGGLNLYQRESSTFRSFVRSATSPGSLSDNSVNVIFEDSLKKLHIGTAGGGVSIFMPLKTVSGISPPGTVYREIISTVSWRTGGGISGFPPIRGFHGYPPGITKYRTTAGRTV